MRVWAEILGLLYELSIGIKIAKPWVKPEEYLRADRSDGRCYLVSVRSIHLKPNLPIRNGLA
jgi:hypothetical protein